MDKLNGFIHFYDMSVALIGDVPPQYEILYFIGTIILFICTMLIILSPLLLFRAVGGR